MTPHSTDPLTLILQAGPLVKFVLLLLLAMSVTSWGVIVMKWLVFKTSLKQNKNFASHFYESNSLKEIEKAAKKNLTPDSKVILQDVHTQLTALPEWKKEALHNVVINTAEKHDIKLGKVAQPIRVAVTGNTISPPIDITLELLGKTRVLHDIEKAIEWIK